MMKIQAGGFPACNKTVQGRTGAKSLERNRLQGELGGNAAAIKKQMAGQNEKHRAFLLRAREGLSLFEKKIEELDGFVAKNQKTTDEDILAQIEAAKEEIQNMQESVQLIQESVDAELQEHVFVMSALEALVDGKGNFPLKTLGEYLAKREKPESQDENQSVRRYTTSDLDKMLEAHRRSMGGVGFSATV